MAIYERDRHQLFEKLAELLGAKNAGTLMEMLPPRDFDAFAHREDVENARTELRAEMIAVRSDFAVLKSEVSAEIGALRADMDAELKSVRTDIGNLRTDMDAEFKSVRTDITNLRTDMDARFELVRAEFALTRASTRKGQIYAALGTVVSTWSLLLATLALT